MAALTPQQALDLAVSYHQSGRLEEAEAIYRQLLISFPAAPDLVHLLGLVAYHRGQFESSLALYRQAIAANPTAAEYHQNLGVLLTDLQRSDEALAALQTALHLKPGHPSIHYNLGNVQVQRRAYSEAIAAYRSALQLQPDLQKAHLNLGLALYAGGRPAEAIEAYRTGLKYHANDPILLNNLGNLLRDEGRLDEALEVYRAALATETDNPVTFSNLANVLKDQGQIAQAVAAFRRSLALKPMPEVGSNLILTLLYDPASDAAAIRQAEEEWNQRHVVPLRSTLRPHSNLPDPDRPLRIGFVSADLREHVVGHSLLPVLRAHDRQSFTWFCYSSSTPDAATERFRSLPVQWRDSAMWSDAQLIAKIREDGIDILVDLSLHTAYNRLLVFAHKPAPVQVSWLGYPGSTGLETIDYRFTDPYLDPLDETPPASFEKPFRLPECWTIFPVPPASPDVNDLPALTTGRVTFGSLNNFSKINPRVLGLWARLLQAVTDSRLLLLTKQGGHKETARDLFRQHGIDEERLQFFEYEPVSANRPNGSFLERYHQFDIALDPFPYNGMTTTCEALWMGVPVVALIGNSGISRASYSLLANVGMADLAASSEDDYIRRATTLARDLPALAALRTGLRERMKNSPLTDASRLARNLEKVYREMWQGWCRNRTGESSLALKSPTPIR